MNKWPSLALEVCLATLALVLIIHTLLLFMALGVRIPGAEFLEDLLSQ